MPLTREALRLQAELDAAVGQVVDQQTRDLVRAWVLAWDEATRDLADTLQQIIGQREAGLPVASNDFARSARLGAILGLIGDRLSQLAKSSASRIMQDVAGVVQQSAAAQRPILAAQLPARYELVGQPSARALDAIVQRVTQQITAAHYPLSSDAYDAVRRELVRGITVGTNPRLTARHMVDRAETGFNGGLNRALTISRTEMLDAHRAAAEHAQQQHADVLSSWTWLAHLSPNTCRSCIAMNGTTHPLYEPGPLDHQNGRCARMPTTKSWAELGIHIPEPAGVAIPDSEKWFAKLSAKQQRVILGRKGWEAWKRGDFPMSEWSQRRSTRGWRDSYAPGPIPTTITSRTHQTAG